MKIIGEWLTVPSPSGAHVVRLFLVNVKKQVESFKSPKASCAAWCTPLILALEAGAGARVGVGAGAGRFW